MRTRSVRRMNYSPVRQMRRSTNSQDELPPQEPHNERRNTGTSTISHEPNTVGTPKPMASNNLEEVYICSCCGMSRELRPSMKFMSTFSSLFFLFNLLVFAFGLANFGMGLWFRIDPKIYEIHKHIETQNFTIAGWLMLFCGFFACITALVGFVAGGRQVVGLLACYFSVMITLTLAFVGTLVLLTVFGLGLPLEQFIIKEIHEQIIQQARNSESTFNSNAAQFLDFIQVKGCGRAIRQLLDLRAGLATGFTLASVVVQLLTIILSVSMFCSIYHWRAHPRPATSQSLARPIETPFEGEGSNFSHRRPESPWRHFAADHQRPGSRTPIVL